MMNYLNKNELTREVIISKGKGKRTKELEKMLVLIADNLFLKLQYIGSEYKDFNHDIKMSGIESLLKKWDKVHPDKGDVFNYYSEVFKRGCAYGFNLMYYKKSKASWKEKPNFIRIDNYY